MRVSDEQLHAILTEESACRSASVVKLALDLRDARADARALWAVRVLWACARKHMLSPTPSPQPHERKDEWSIVVPFYRDDFVEWQDFERTTAEAVCIAAAEALVADDPTLGIES